MGLMKGPALSAFQRERSGGFDAQRGMECLQVPGLRQIGPFQPVADLAGSAISADAGIRRFACGLRGIHETSERRGWEKFLVAMCEINFDPRIVMIPPHGDLSDLPRGMIAQFIRTPPLPCRPQSADEQKKNQQAGQVSVHALM